MLLLRPHVLLQNLMESKRSVRKSTADIPVTVTGCAHTAIGRESPAMDAAMKVKAASTMDAVTNSIDSLAVLENAPTNATAAVEGIVATGRQDDELQL